MKKIFYIGLIAFLAFSLIGCGSRKPTLTKETKIQDSTYTKEKTVIRDTTVSLPGENLKVNVPLKELGPVPFIRKSGKLTLNISLLDGQHLLVECNTDSLELELELKDKIITTLHERLTNKSQKIRVPEPYTPWYKNILAGFGMLFLIIILVVVGVKIFKP